eukprot:15343925-Ditylum_brightwellii.AAC.3
MPQRKRSKMPPGELEEVHKRDREQQQQRRRDQHQQQQYINQLHGHRKMLSNEDTTHIRQQYAAQHHT